MKQIIQDISSGKTILEDVPAPLVTAGHVLIRTYRSLVSLGTERMLVDFGRASLINKARQHPDRVSEVYSKIRSDGLKPTLKAVYRKLSEPIPMGYCNAGEVIEVGKGVSEFNVGDRVISNGYHAEIVCVPKNLVAKIPDGVSYDEASFAVVGSIALQGIRLINPTFGERIAVVGLGLLGQIAVQLLKGNGCEVMGFDHDQSKVELAASWGIKAFNVANGDPYEFAVAETNNVGADAVLITASSRDHKIISSAAKMSRKQGRIVLVGVVGLNINRSDFYEKELTFKVSCSYGPGRYDYNYEQMGNDYPLPYVRWTEKRNFEAVLNALLNGTLKVLPLISQVVELDHYEEIYSKIGDGDLIASIIKYPTNISTKDDCLRVSDNVFEGRKGVLAVIGSGNYVRSTVMPHLKKLHANVKYIVSSKGLSGTITAKKYDITFTTTDFQKALSDPEVDAVIIATRHNLHAEQVIESLKAGKHVFIEKPLAITYEELESIDEIYRKCGTTLTVGFNRRFSPFIQDAKKHLGASNGAISVIATMNAGYIPHNMWVHDLNVGGGRIIGEACHLIDLITYLTESRVVKVVMNSLGPEQKSNTDNASILLYYENGSQGVINYFSNGSKAYSKERIEIFSQNRTIIIDNFRKSKYYGFRTSGLSMTQNKGHSEQFKRFINQLKHGGPAIIPFTDIMNTSKTAIAAVESLKEGTWVNV